jgi:prepilin-type N-terminal cleavage/methylation domain-containing protein/prepilin-type processing-associated H-X9-DG protein
MKKGFTIIELIIVCAILLLLSALIIPHFSRAKEQAILTLCANNLYQLSRAAVPFMEDNNNYNIILHHGKFLELVKESLYIDLFNCPGSTRTPTVDNIWLDYEFYFPWPENYPADNVVTTDRIRDYRTFDFMPTNRNHIRPSLNHKNRYTNALFGDGHIETIRFVEFSPEK